MPPPPPSSSLLTSRHLRLALFALFLSSFAAYLVHQARTGALTIMQSRLQLRACSLPWDWHLAPPLLLRCVAGIALFAALLANPAALQRALRPPWLRFALPAVFFSVIIWLTLKDAIVHEGDLPPFYLWVAGCAGALLAWIALRAGSAPAPPPLIPARSAPLTRFEPFLRRWGLLLAFLAGCAAAIAGAAGILGWYPINVDSESQIAQARMLARGLFALPISPQLHFAIAMPYIVYGPHGIFTQFPPGYIAPLALVIRLGLPLHTVDVLAAGAIAAGTAALAWWIAPRPQRAIVSLLATLLLCCSPQFIMLTGSMMNNTLTTCCTMAALVCALRAGRLLRARRNAPGLLAFCGLALGWAIAIKPYTGAIHVAFWSACAAGLLALLYRRSGAAAAVRALCRLWPAPLGLALPLAGLAFYNWKTTGHPLQLGYSAANASTRLGFVPDAEGYPYTPFNAYDNFVAGGVMLNSILFGWALGSWWPLLAWWLRAAWRPRYWLLAALPALQAAGYGLYHYFDLHFGPRFYFEVIPLLIVASALGLARLFAHPGWLRRAALCAVLLLAATGCWRGTRYFAERYQPRVGTHAAIAKFMAQHAAQRPAVFLISASINELCGTYYLGEPGKPVYFIFRDRAAQAATAPELQGFTWFDTGL